MVKNETKISLLNSQLKYYNERNLNLFCACYHPEVETYFLGSEIKEKGIKPFRARFQKLFESSPDLHCEIKSRIILNDSVIEEEFASGSSLYPEGISAALIYNFKDGLIYSICIVK